MIGRSSRWTLVAVLTVLLGFASAGIAQDLDAMLNEAHELYQRGRYDEGLSKLRMILNQDPSSEDAMRLRDAIEFRAWAKMMIQGDAHAAVVKQIMELALPAAREKGGDRDAIVALVAKLDSGEWAERANAMRQLAADHGEYVVPVLLPRLESGSTDTRAAAMEWLRRLGTQSVLPLIQALEHDSPMIKANALTVLGQIGDPRAQPYIAAYGAPGYPIQQVRDAAIRAMADLGAGLFVGDAATQMLALAEAYYRGDKAVVDPFRAVYTVWHFADGNLVAHEVTRDVYHLKLAEEVLFDLLEMEPGSTPARVLLASVLIAQAEAGRASDEETALQNAAVLAAAEGPDILDQVVSKAIADGRPEIAAGAVRVLASIVNAGNFRSPNGLTEAVHAPYKRVRFAAALALAAIDPAVDYPERSKVVPVLMEALGQDSVRSAVVIDDQAETLNKLVGDLNQRGWYAYGVAKGSLGLARIREYPIEDLVVIRYDLADRTVNEVIKTLRTDERTQERPIALLVEDRDMDAAREAFEDRVQVFIPRPLVAEAYEPELRGALGELEGARAEAVRVAAEAATRLRDMQPHAMTGLASAPAVSALIGTLKGDDSVRIPAMEALARIGDPAAMAPLLEVFLDSTASEPVRGNAALALAHVSASSGTPAPEFLGALAEAIKGEGSLDYMLMLGKAVGVAPIGASERIALLNALRPRVHVDNVE
jgi:HEAT repeat protein